MKEEKKVSAKKPEKKKPEKKAGKKPEKKKADRSESLKESSEKKKKTPEKESDEKKTSEKEPEEDKDVKNPADEKTEAAEDTENTENEKTEVKEEKPEDKEKDDKSDEEKSDVDKSDEEKPSAASKEQKQRVNRKTVPEQKKSLGKVIPLSGKSIFAIFLALVVVVMVILVMFLPAFRVRNATVEGNVALSDQEILAAAGLEYNAHLMSGVSGNIFDILKLDYGKTEERIMKENPYIEDIRISIKLPSTVEIKVKERSKICYIRTPDGYAALDKDGIVLELSSSNSGKNVRPVICGLEVKYCELGKPVRIENMNDYKKSIIVLGAILAADNASVGGDYQMFENTSEVRILPSGYIFLTIYSPSGHLIQIKLNGTEGIGDKMAWLLYVFNGDGFDKITVDGALDMTGDEYIFDEYD